MSSYVGRMSGKGIKVWDTYEPSNTSSILTNVIIQHWDFPDGFIPVSLLDSGYRMINSGQAFLYLDGKSPVEGSFAQMLDLSLLFLCCQCTRRWLGTQRVHSQRSGEQHGI
jgi:hexosaminidase